VVVQGPQIWPGEDDTVAVYDEELRTHAVRNYAVNDERANPFMAETVRRSDSKMEESAREIREKDAKREGREALISVSELFMADRSGPAQQGGARL